MAPLGRFGEGFPQTVDYVLIADAERITAERIDRVAVFAADSSLRDLRGTLPMLAILASPHSPRPQSRVILFVAASAHKKMPPCLFVTLAV